MNGQNARNLKAHLTRFAFPSARGSMRLRQQGHQPLVV